MPKLDLSLLEPYFEKGKDFELTAEQYEEKVKKPLPQTKYHITKKSPLAKLAHENGFSVQVEERVHRVLVFKKDKNPKQ